MDNYAERKQAKIDRLKERAEKARSEAKSLSDEAHRMGDAIPFGQPILVGHHSEQRDRNFRNRIHNKLGKSVEASKRADYLDGRVEAAESNRSISSDDPEAMTKLKEKIENAEIRQELMKGANKIIRKKISDSEKIAKLREVYGWKEEACKKILEKDCFGNIGFPQYELTNNNANIRRMKQRVEGLKRLEGRKTKEVEFEGFKVVENVEENRIQFIFPDKPSTEIRTILKSHGFRWSPYNVAWQRQLNSTGKFAANEAMKRIVSGVEND